MNVDDTAALEAIERAAFEDLHAAADPALRRDLGLQGLTIGGAFVSVAAALPVSAVVVNRAIGLGVAEPGSRRMVEAIVRTYRDDGVARPFIHVLDDARPPELRAWLGELGFERARGWAQFTRGREAPPKVTTDLTVRAATPADAPAFGRILADAFDLGGLAVPWLGRLIGRPGWHVYMSFGGDVPAGTGTLYVRDGVGLVDWGATAPDFRRRGGQGAVMGRRIEDARRSNKGPLGGVKRGHSVFEACPRSP